ncbi:hypothetical protein [Peribacillus frigoritolerans]|uniref:hypothetical protein n=1 Tax=Peribacillus castrilensis TaxID=2897690 RepID=UPI002DC74D99|nr:hypothetical protein [Peribacillus castrilensis]
MSSRNVRKGMVNYGESKSFSGFNAFELLVLCGFLTWFGVEKFNFNGVATFIISFIFLIIIFFTRFYLLLSVLFSMAWGGIGFLLITFLVYVTGGSPTLSLIIGIVGFILAALISFGARTLGKQYYDDIEVN